jgi:transcriptional regulator with XRE-family HTH domain
MENVLMRFCRESNRFTIKIVAGKLGIAAEMYKEMEKGEVLLTRKQAEQLGELYNTDPSYFYKEAIQLDLLQTRMMIIKILKKENNLLIAKLKKKEAAAIKRNASASRGDMAAAKRDRMAERKVN